MAFHRAGSWHNQGVRASPQKHRIRMPLQRLPVRLADRVSGHPDLLVVEGHVGLAVVEVGFQAAADEEAAIGSDGDVALVEEAVDVGSEEEPVVEAVLASLSDGADVGGVQDGEGFFSGDGAAALVVVGYQDAEGALAQAGTVEAGISEDRARLGRELGRHRHGGEARGDLVQEPAAGSGGGVEILALDDALPELRGRGNPEVFRKEEGIAQEDAADL